MVAHHRERVAGPRSLSSTTWTAGAPPTSTQSAPVHRGGAVSTSGERDDRGPEPQQVLDGALLLEPGPQRREVLVADLDQVGHSNSPLDPRDEIRRAPRDGRARVDVVAHRRPATQAGQKVENDVSAWLDAAPSEQTCTTRGSPTPPTGCSRQSTSNVYDAAPSGPTRPQPWRCGRLRTGLPRARPPPPADGRRAGVRGRRRHSSWRTAPSARAAPGRRPHWPHCLPRARPSRRPRGSHDVDQGLPHDERSPTLGLHGHRTITGPRLGPCTCSRSTRRHGCRRTSS